MAPGNTSTAVVALQLQAKAQWRQVEVDQELADQVMAQRKVGSTASSVSCVCAFFECFHLHALHLTCSTSLLTTMPPNHPPPQAVKGASQELDSQRKAQGGNTNGGGAAMDKMLRARRLLKKAERLQWEMNQQLEATWKSFTVS